MGGKASKQLSVVLAIAHGGLGEGIRDLLATVFDSVVTVADERSLRRCTASLSPDLVVVDLDLVRSRTRQLLTELIEESPKRPVLVLTTTEDPVLTREMHAAGAAGCLVKGRLGSELIPRAEALLARSPSVRAEGAGGLSRREGADPGGASTGRGKTP